MTLEALVDPEEQEPNRRDEPEGPQAGSSAAQVGETEQGGGAEEPHAADEVDGAALAKEQVGPLGRTQREPGEAPREGRAVRRGDGGVAAP